MAGGLAIKLWPGLGLAALALVGCGDLGATDEEPSKAQLEGERGYGSRLSGGWRASGSSSSSGWRASESSTSKGWRASEAGERGYSGYESPADETSAINPTPEKLDGTDSYEFEPDDIERAEEASLEVREYCEGAVSEAQEVGCLSHVEPSEVP